MRTDQSTSSLSLRDFCHGGCLRTLRARTEQGYLTGDVRQKYCKHVVNDYPVGIVTLDHSPVHPNSRVLGGTLVFRDTRVMAQTLLDYIAAGDSLDTFLEQLPSVDRRDAVEFLRLAREEDHS
jgi:uncharacterized protein (DUF433 family)